MVKNYFNITRKTTILPAANSRLLLFSDENLIHKSWCSLYLDFKPNGPITFLGCGSLDSIIKRLLNALKPFIGPRMMYGLGDKKLFWILSLSSPHAAIYVEEDGNNSLYLYVLARDGEPLPTTYLTINYRIIWIELLEKLYRPH